MKSVLAFGDSNTWGLVPGTKENARFPWEIRWTGALENRCKTLRIVEEGLCGRTTAHEDAERPGRNGATMLSMVLESHAPLDAAIIMLGTNDCKRAYSLSTNEIGKGIEQCLDIIEKHLPARNILLISPVFLGKDVWKADKDPAFDQQSVLTCYALKGVYSRIAEERGTAFLAASDYVRADDADAEHLNAEGHRLFASAVYDKLKKMNVIAE